MFGFLSADLLLSYAIPTITVILAVLGILFGKDGNISSLTRTGTLILGLTIVSGTLGLWDVYRKDSESRAAKIETAQANSNIRRINNLLTAGTGGLSKKVTHMDLWLTVIDDGGAGTTTPTEEIAGPGDDGKRVRSALADQFNGLFVSKTDLGEVVDIKFTYLNDDLAFHITPKTTTQFAVHQTVSGSSLDYTCERDCPTGKPAPLGKRFVLRRDLTGNVQSVGFDLRQDNVLAEIVANVERLKGEWLEIKFKFTDKREFEKLKELLAGLQVNFKFYIDDLKKAGRCTAAFFFRVGTKIVFDERKLLATLHSQGVDPIDIDVCEDPP
jgi:hypothetical protein